MIRKLKAWLERRKANKMMADRFDAGMPLPETYSREQVETAYNMGFKDGRKDGLAIAKDQALRSLKDILKQQNQTKR